MGSPGRFAGLLKTAAIRVPRPGGRRLGGTDTDGEQVIEGDVQPPVAAASVMDGLGTLHVMGMAMLDT
ncbi:hypothetical protein RHS04_08234 [Rhizoctonia solani]|uniref:Uncharacterized protein n=1 Tax=Rhizoctonia solani TaxID=456999 RepID=A0A8H7I6F5_9AGAM